MTLLACLGTETLIVPIRHEIIVALPTNQLG
jgi:hypothetical protein